MTDHSNPGYDPFTGEEELQGPERYLRAGEELLIYTPDIQIKKFRFDAYLTNTRLFLTDQAEKTPGVTAKEIPIGSVVDTYLEHSPAQEPILVLSIRTSEDDLRTMKMTFVHTGADRLPQAEEWMHLIRHGKVRQKPGDTPSPGASSSSPLPISAEARALSETIVYPEKTTVEPFPPMPAQPATETRDGRSGGVSPPPLQRERQREAEPPAKVFPVEGASITQIQFCFHCGHRLPPNANFCPYCGTRMHQAPTHGTPHVPVQQKKVIDEPPGAMTKEKEKKKKMLGWLFRRK
ncbi:MAG TPA: zinc ribbon domain-containing protein [Methanolinea sp.]|nr:zinc ribbon domain-containing protein [Methanolinea sp.]HQK55514.1 zinc ribbon domain-containing protein [Methanolinea sp.]